jgi:hypothetical protein
MFTGGERVGFAIVTLASTTGWLVESITQSLSIPVLLGVSAALAETLVTTLASWLFFPLLPTIISIFL